MLYSRWWANQHFGQDDDSLSILDLVNSGTIDCKLAALLWLLIEQRSSVMVAAGPSFAGKTTLLHALLDFLPPDPEKIFLKGYFENFAFVEYSRPESAYLVSEEISNHSYEYLWGSQAIRAFSLLSMGYPLGATIHARTAEEVVYVLNQWIGIPLPLISRLGVIVILRARAGQHYHDEPVRRVNSVSLVIPAQEGLGIQVLAARRFSEQGFDYLGEEMMQQAVDGRYHIEKCQVNTEIESRERYLKHLRKQGMSSRSQVRNAVLDYYRSQHG